MLSGCEPSADRRICIIAQSIHTTPMLYRESADRYAVLEPSSGAHLFAVGCWIYRVERCRLYSRCALYPLYSTHLIQYTIPQKRRNQKERYSCPFMGYTTTTTTTTQGTYTHIRGWQFFREATTTKEI